MTRYAPRIDSDEDGFTLCIPDPFTGEDRYTFPLDAGSLDAFYDQVKARIGPYLREQQAAHDSFRRGGWRSFVCAPADVDESGGVSDEARDAYDGYPDASGYHITDPKHPDFHSVHADIWDARDGK